MLIVSLKLATVAAVLFCIVVPGHRIEVDSLNSPTAKPLPDGTSNLATIMSHSRDHLANLPKNFSFCNCLPKNHLMIGKRDAVNALSRSGALA